MPLARLLRISDPPQRSALHAGSLPGRSEPALAARRRDDERRRLRRRLVRRRPDPRRLPQHRAGLERPQPARARRPRQLVALLHAHTSGDRQRRAADELPSLPLRALALHAQRIHQRVRDAQARPRAHRRSVALSQDRGPDRHRGAVLPRVDLRPRGRSAGGDRAGGRAGRSGRQPARGPASLPGHHRNDRRRDHVGRPVLERGQVALAVLHDGRAHAAQALSRTAVAQGALRGGAADRVRAAGRRRRRLERGARGELWHRRPGRDEMRPFRPQAPSKSILVGA